MTFGPLEATFHRFNHAKRCAKAKARPITHVPAKKRVTISEI